MGGAGEAAAAAINLALPAIQAIATIQILNRQKDHYDDVARERIALIDEAVTNYCNDIDACIASGLFSDAYGSIPVAALFNPIDQLEEQFQTINQNLQNLPATDRLAAAVNELTVSRDMARMAFFCPAFAQHMHQSCIQIKDLLNGKLPIDDAIDVLTDNAEQAALTGRVGNIKQMNARSMGIRRLQMQAQGRREIGLMIDYANGASPQQGQVNLQSMFNTAANRMNLALQQAQLIQNSLQNANNLAAAGDPTALAQIQTKINKIFNVLGQEAQRGNLVNSFQPNLASVIQPVINSISSALHGGRADAPNNDDQGTPNSTSNSTAQSSTYQGSIFVDQNSGK